jgi:hypothetical protein
MIRLLILLLSFLLFMSFAVVATGIVYLIVFLTMTWIFSSFAVFRPYPWAPWAGTAFLFVVALVTTIRRRIPDLSGLLWDSGTHGDAPSEFSVHGRGGHLWNVNPLGPQSVGSIAAIGAAILCLGPALAVNAIVAVLEEWREGHPPPPRP